MRIRFINRVDPGSPFLRDLVPYLAQQGHKVEVVLSATRYRTGQIPLEARFDNPNIRLISIPVRNPLPGIFGRWWQIFAFIVGAMVVSLFGRDVDLNYFLTQPPLFSIWGIALKILRRQDFAVMVMDLYPEVAIAYGIVQERSLSAKFMRWVSIFTLKHSTAVFVIGRCMLERVAALGIPHDRIVCETLWANNEFVFPVDRQENTLAQELGLQSDFIVLYSGNLGIGHYFDDLLEVARRLKDKPRLSFVILGEGRRRAEVIRAKCQYELNNVVILPYQPEENLSQSLSMGNIHFICLRSEFTGLMVPSKSYGVFAAGRSAIYQGDAWGEIAREIEECSIGSVIPHKDADALESAILHYYENPKLAEIEGKRALHLAQTRFSRDSSLQRYERTLRIVLKNSVKS